MHPDELWSEAVHATRGFFDAGVDAATCAPLSPESTAALRSALAPWERARLRPGQARRLQGALDALRAIDRVAS